MEIIKQLKSFKYNNNNYTAVIVVGDENKNQGNLPQDHIGGAKQILVKVRITFFSYQLIKVLLNLWLIYI